MNYIPKFRILRLIIWRITGIMIQRTPFTDKYFIFSSRMDLFMNIVLRGKGTFRRIGFGKFMISYRAPYFFSFFRSEIHFKIVEKKLILGETFYFIYKQNRIGSFNTKIGSDNIERAHEYCNALNRKEVTLSDLKRMLRNYNSNKGYFTPLIED